MKYKLSKQGIEAIMMVFNNGFANMVVGKDADMTSVFEELEWQINDDLELFCDNPPMFNLSEIVNAIEEEE